MLSGRNARPVAGLASLLIGDGLCERLFQRNRRLETQFVMQLSAAHGKRRSKIERGDGIAAWERRVRRFGHTALPSCSLSKAIKPDTVRHRVGVRDVEGLPIGGGMADHGGDGGGDIVDKAVGGRPVEPGRGQIKPLRFRQHRTDRPAEAMLPVGRTEHHRQAQYRPWNRQAARQSLDRDLVVVIEPGVGGVQRTRWVRAIGIKARSKRRVFVQRVSVGAPAFGAVEEAVVPIDVGRAEQDVLTDGSVDFSEKALCLRRRVGDDVDQDIYLLCTYDVPNGSGIISVHAHADHTAAFSGRSMARGIDDVLTALRHGTGGRVADHAAAAKNENLHPRVSMSRTVDICSG